MDKKRKNLSEQQILMSHLTAPRPGVDHDGDISVGINEDKATGLILSAVQLKELSFFSLNSLNTVFESLKSAEYYDQLKRDIAQDGIINALIALPNGELVEGHSRLKVASELGLKSVPVRFILNTLSTQEVKRRVYLGNLNRFEIPFDMRLILFAEIYPDYFHAAPQTLDQQHQRHKHDDASISQPTTAKMVAAAMGLSDRQVRNEKEVFLKAKELSGDDIPSPMHVAQARSGLRNEKVKRKLERWLPKENKESLGELCLVNEEGEALITIHKEAWPLSIDLEALIEINCQWAAAQQILMKKKHSQE